MLALLQKGMITCGIWICRDDLEPPTNVWFPGVINTNFLGWKPPWIHTNNFQKFELLHVIVTVSASETLLLSVMFYYLFKFSPLVL